MNIRILLAVLVLAAGSSCYREGGKARVDDDLGSTVPTATTTAVTGGTVSAMANEDKDFVIRAAQTGLAEVSMGQIAAQNAASADVRAYGTRMVTDHSKANDELMQLATLKGLALPTAPDEHHKEAAQHISSLRANEFDAMYLTHMIDDHQKAVADFQKMTTSAQDADVKSWAVKTLPVLQEHLTLARDLQTRVPKRPS
jgi:putative membrane protein